MSHFGSSSDSLMTWKAQRFSPFIREILHRTNVPSWTLSIVAAGFESPDIGRAFCQMLESLQTFRRPSVESGKVEESLLTTIKRSSNRYSIKTRSLGCSILIDHAIR
jgi:hypothetical protein